MNIQEYDVLNCIEKEAYTNQRILSELTGYSLGKVNSSVKKLVDEGYLNEEMRCTDKAYEESLRKKPRNAIILAAGFGMRMIPMNTERSKGILEVRGETLIERLIRQLHEVDVREIDIVVGFMKEQYEFLIDKYHVNLVYNKDYATRNNLYSLAKVVDKVENTYIIPCDLWSYQNPFSDTEWYSWYMVNDKLVEESNLRINRKKELVEINEQECGNQMLGIAYLLREEAELLKRRLSDMLNRKEYKYSFWEEALMQNGRMLLSPREVSRNLVYEINTLEELRELDENSNHLKSDCIMQIAEVLQCKTSEITDIEVVRREVTNRSFGFTCKGKRYIMRVPERGSEEIVNRRNEYQVYKALEGTGISEDVLFLFPETGYKITSVIEDSRTCDPRSEEDVKRCMDKLREFHGYGLRVEHTFDLYERVEYFEELWKGAPSVYRDYVQTKQKIYELQEVIEKAPKSIGLAYIDAIPDNFIFAGDNTYLIDWEYAGMQDVHVDIAMFAVYARYDGHQVDSLIDFYFEGKCEDAVRIKIYAYIAIAGLMWSNWCEYQRICGIEFGEYSLNQYRYAKEYYAIVMEELMKKNA